MKFSAETIQESIMVSPERLKQTYDSTIKSRNNLVFKKHDGNFVPKVCCFCDRIIMHGDEKFFPVKCLENKEVQKCLKLDKGDWEILGVSDIIKTEILGQYKQKFITS